MLKYKRFDPPIASDLLPFYTEDGREITLEEAYTLREQGVRYYRWEPIRWGGTALEALLSPESFQGVEDEALRTYLRDEASKMEPGKCDVLNDKHTRSREDRLYGYNAVGYGKDTDGTVWVEGPAYVCHNYRGRLLR